MKNKKIMIIIICVLCVLALLTFIILNNNTKVLKEEKITKLSDKATGVTLFNNNGLDKNTKLQVKQDKNEYDDVKKKSDKYISYDIYLVNNNNKKVKLNSNVDVSIKIPKGFDRKNLVVFYVEDNKIKETYKVSVKNDIATFSTSHFSVYVLAELKKEEITTTTSQTETTTTSNNKSTTTKTPNGVSETTTTKKECSNTPENNYILAYRFSSLLSVSEADAQYNNLKNGLFTKACDYFRNGVFDGYGVQCSIDHILASSSNCYDKFVGITIRVIAINSYNHESYIGYLKEDGSVHITSHTPAHE